MICIHEGPSMNSNQQSIPVFVVSLARAQQRREEIRSHLDALGIEYRLMDAVDGREMSEADRAKVVAPGVSIHAGAIGCYLSHLNIYTAMLAEGLPLALVLEDDARLSPRAVGLLRQGFKSLDFDYCFLDSDDHNDRGPIYYDRDEAIQVADGVQAYRLSAGPQTTHAYLITLAGARKRMEHAFPIAKAIDLYDHLPYPIVFRAIVSPKLAWVSEHSLTSFTSTKADDPASLRFAWLRRHPLFYRVRDLIRLKQLRRSLEVRQMVRSGTLPEKGRWVPLPSGREIVM